jgi:hypothetical protein
VDIINGRALIEWFGEWPSFHDAEALALRLDSGQRANGIAGLQLDVHLFAVDGRLPNGSLNFVNHTVATLEFEEIEDLELDGRCRYVLVTEVEPHEPGPHPVYGR